jgi:outer membrane beta-barrel protein
LLLLCSSLLGGLVPSRLGGVALAQDFSDYEIRVIKNKFFTKKYRLEVDVGLGGVMNQSFHYSYLAMAGIGFHLSETFGLHAEGGYALNQNKEACDLLGKDFQINPLINEMQTYYGAYLSYTPIYGKYQLGSGDVLYFDWFFSAGGGLAAVRQRQGGCGGEEIEENTEAWATNPQFNIGTGQRYFLGTNTALIWTLRMLMFQPAPAPGSEAQPSLLGDGIQNVILSLGLGYFL